MSSTGAGSARAGAQRKGESRASQKRMRLPPSRMIVFLFSPGHYGAHSAPRGDQPGEVVELVAVEVRDDPVAHAVAREVLDVEAVTRGGALPRGVAAGAHEDVDHVLAALVDEHRHLLARQVVHACAGEL